MQQNKKQLVTVLCQTHPELKNKKENIRRFDHQLQHLRPQDKIDIVIFPEMAFTGYNFRDAKDIKDMAVSFGEGEEFEFARSLALRLKAYVLFGYVESIEQHGKTLLYNSAAMSDREGNFIFNTRKTHLYYADELWAEEGDGFKSIVIKNLIGQSFNCAVGICMDINPKNFTSGKNELGDFVEANKCEVILFPTNWIDSDRENEDSSVDIYNYWLNRLKPILKGKRNVYLLAADRVGREYSFYDKKQFWFMGGSAVLSINPNKLVKMLDKTLERYLKVTIDLPSN